MTAFARRRQIAVLVAAVAIACGLSFYVGAHYGSVATVAHLRSISFGSRQANLQRLLELDSILASNDTALARRKTIALALAEYIGLDDEVVGALVPPTDVMRSSAPAVRALVAEYCRSESAKFHANSNLDFCSEVAKRSNKSFERTRGG